MTDFQPGATGTDEVLFAVDGSLGRVLLNRPRAINALTRAMCEAMTAQLQAWQEDPAVRAISIEGAGERGLCAGADVRAVRERFLAGDDSVFGFFDVEYALDAMVAAYPRPVVAVMDGIVMGGGLGLSAFADHRLVTERSTIAMPETIIGLFPDVGARHWLARTPGLLGMHLALTGDSFDGADAIAIGLADALVDSADLPGALQRVAAGESVEGVGDPSPPSKLATQRDWVDECYSAEDPAAIVRRLRDRPEPAARAAADAIEARSPVSVWVTWESVRRAADDTSPEQTLADDRVLIEGCIRHGDFVEGVRAQLVDKDRRPRWPDPLGSEPSERAADILAALQPR
ncbi:MAG: enoyl-CoA hydratase/isomerase family protein [Micrococcales bacterium]|nr:enoyl-CoA hydratase/isomerase family protein [Micrococcales bacterium]